MEAWGKPCYYLIRRMICCNVNISKTKAIILLEKRFEDTNVAILSRKSKKDRQYNGKK